MNDPFDDYELYRAMADTLDDMYQLLIGGNDLTGCITDRRRRTKRLLEQWRLKTRREELAVLRKAAP